ncbi:uncharacterized protein [Narcine bancroftii]|uniref:uncharacterized protein isoform X2 n=1 Tax=Narcine bancroftii TaxID=1343680 RepID=UPI00383140FB
MIITTWLIYLLGQALHDWTTSLIGKHTSGRFPSFKRGGSNSKLTGTATRIDPVCSSKTLTSNESPSDDHESPHRGEEDCLTVPNPAEHQLLQPTWLPESKLHAPPEDRPLQTSVLKKNQTLEASLTPGSNCHFSPGVKVLDPPCVSKSKDLIPSVDHPLYVPSISRSKGQPCYPESKNHNLLQNQGLHTRCVSDGNNPLPPEDQQLNTQNASEAKNLIPLDSQQQCALCLSGQKNTIPAENQPSASGAKDPLPVKGHQLHTMCVSKSKNLVSPENQPSCGPCMPEQKKSVCQEDQSLCIPCSSRSRGCILSEDQPVLCPLIPKSTDQPSQACCIQETERQGGHRCFPKKCTSDK